MVLRLRLESPDWRKAKCAYPKPTAELCAPFDDDTDEAQKFCRGEDGKPPCPIQHECLIFALINNNSHGTWGGTSETDRKAIRKRWPLGKSVKQDDKTTWVPRIEWRVFARGLPTSWFGASALRKEIDAENRSE